MSEPERPSDRLGGLYESTGLFEGPVARWPEYLAALRAPMVDEVVGDDQIAELWQNFGAAISLPALRRAYGDYWPRRPVPGERAWVFRAAPAPGVPCGELAAWGGLRPDPVEPIVWTMLGVWPQHQGRGWADFIRRWLVEVAAAEYPAARYAALEVLRGNLEHLDRWLHRTPRGWRRVGELAVPPPGAEIFAWEITRDGVLPKTLTGRSAENLCSE